MSRDAFLSQERVLDHRNAKQLGMLVSLMEVPPRANVLYVVHRWSGPDQPDSANNDAYMQVSRNLFRMGISTHSPILMFTVWVSQDPKSANVIHRKFDFPPRRCRGPAGRDP